MITSYSENINVFHIDEKDYFRYNLTKACSLKTTTEYQNGFTSKRRGGIYVSSRTGNRQNKKKRQWLYWLGGIILLLILVGAGYFFYVYNKLDNTVDVMHDPLDRDDNPDRQKELESIFKDKKSVNILLLGVDEVGDDKGRSDTIILLSLNPNTNAIKMLSVPRDTYVNIPGRGMDKINHAYAYGDAELSIQTFEEAFDLPVHFYARINMEGFQDGIDALGGVTVQNDLNFKQDGVDFPTGDIHLNGSDALKYIRMRKEDPRGDLGRNERQRNVIKAAMNEAASFSSITKVGNLLDILGDNVRTDLNMDRLKSLFSDYRGTRKNIDSMEIDGEGQTINSIWYYVVPDDELHRIHDEITTHMEDR